MLPPESVLTIAGPAQRLRGHLPGAYSVDVRPNKRNSRAKKCCDVHTQHGNITDSVRLLLASLSHPAAYRIVDETCEVIMAGVRINGRLFKQGDHCEFLPKVAQRRNVPGVGGLDGSSLSHCVATIGMFYRFNMVGGESPALFVSVIRREQVCRENNMIVLNTVSNDTGLLGFSHVHSPKHVLIHVDAITSKVKLVPHYDIAKRDNFMCAINMWSVR